MKKVYLITNIEDYGKLMAFCIENDICVWRTYWDDRERGNRCFEINWKEKRCYYSSKQYYQSMGYQIITPTFRVNEYGNYKMGELN